MRYFFLAYLLAGVLILGLAGFRGEKFSHTPMEILDDMDQQAKITAQHPSAFFTVGPNAGQGSRLPVAGVVPMGLTVPEASAASGHYEPYGFTHGADYYNSGHMGDFYGDGFPEQIKVDETLLRLGKERYDINCAICHGVSGDGAGVTAKFGIVGIANLHLPPFQDTKDPAYRANGQIFEVISIGKGLMGAYGANIPVRERWAIIAWIRTLQMSRKAPLSDKSVSEAWEKLKPATAATPATK